MTAAPGVQRPVPEADALLSAIADAALDAVVVADLRGRILWWNAIAARVFGWGADEVRGRTVGEVLVPERYRVAHERGIARHAETGASTISGRRVPLQALRKDGSELSVEMQMTRVEAAGTTLLVAFLRDATEHGRARVRASEAEALADSVLASLDSHVAVIGRGGTIFAVNDPWRRFAMENGAKMEAVAVGVNYLEACARSNSNDALARQAHVGIIAVLDGVRDRFVLEYPCNAPDRERWFSMVVTPLRAPWRGAVIAHTDVSERRAMEEALRVPARSDVLTGLPNRILFADRLEQTLLQRQRDDGKCALMFIDLDHFKEVNDTLGHPAGDALLCEVARRFHKQLRKTDTVARFGGDEFLVLLPEVRTGESTAVVARKLLDALDPPFHWQGRALQAEASIGIVVAPDHGEDATTLLRRADIAMYAAKRTRREYAFYTTEDDRDAAQRLTIVNDLRAAVAQDQLFLAFQPIVDVRNDDCVAVEALVRWHHPDRGIIEPKDFIPIAEETGAIRRVSRWVLNDAIRACRAWQQVAPGCGVSVNLAMHDLRDTELPRVVASLLECWRLPPELLTLEITERGAMIEADLVCVVVSQIRATGVRFALDDYGAGYAQVSALQRLPLSEIKLDGSFVARIDTLEAEEIVRSTVDLSRRLGLAVVAENVESGEALEKLIRLGCELVQGNWVSRPRRERDLRAWLGGRRKSMEPLVSSAG